MRGKKVSSIMMPIAGPLAAVLLFLMIAMRVLLLFLLFQAFNRAGEIERSPLDPSRKDYIHGPDI
jgi:hypothetical protein